jgi:two-component system LytT family sensor kinase
MNLCTLVAKSCALLIANFCALLFTDYKSSTCMKDKIINWFKRYWIHVLAWTIFINYETIVVGLIFGIYGHPLTYLLHYIINILFFYLNACIFFPWIHAKRSTVVLTLPIVVVIDIASFILVNYGIDYILVSQQIIVHAGHFTLNEEYSLKILYRCIYFLSFSTGYYFLTTFLNERKKTSELENQRLHSIINNERLAAELFRAENSFLKAQISPHFLFNTLDYIYHSIDSNAQDAADAIIVLSKIMRYSIDPTQDDGFVLLGEEIQQVQNLISLYQLRKPNSLILELRIAEEVRRIRFIPLVLLTLVENTYKHADLTKSRMAFMSIYIEDGILNIETGNHFNIHVKTSGTGNGIKNTKNRLQDAFGNSVSFESRSNEDGYFTVSIKVPTNELTTCAPTNSQFTR